MKAFEFEKGKIDTSKILGPKPPVVPITPRLTRTVPSNIARVIGNFDEIHSEASF